MTDRAVSDVVGFVLSFAVIMASVALVSTVGFDQLEEARETEELKGASHGMIELAESFSPINRRGERTARAGLALSGGSLQLQRSGLTISAGGTTETVGLWGLEYRISGTPLVYEGGAVFYGEGGIVSHRPSVSCQDNGGSTVAIVSLLTLDTDAFYIARGADRTRLPATEGTNMGDQRIDITDAEILSDEGRVTLSATRSGSAVHVRKRFQTPQTVSIDFQDAATPAGWDRFGDRADSGWSVSGDSLTCSGVDRVVVRTTTAAVTVSGR